MRRMSERLLSYELYKALSSRLLRVTALLLLILNVAICAVSTYRPEYEGDKYIDYVYGIYRDDPELFFSEYERIEKLFENADFFHSPQSIYGGDYYSDDYLFEQVYRIVRADELYHERLAEVVERSYVTCRRFEGLGMTESYLYREQERVAGLYTYLYENVRLGDEPVSGWDKYFGYHADFFPIYILITVICVFIAQHEVTSGFFAIAATCRHGRSGSAAAKLLAALILTAAATLVFALSSFVTAGFASGGYSSPFYAAQTASALTLSPLEVSLGGAALLGALTKTAAAVLYCAVLFAVTTAIKSTAASIGAGLGIMAVNYYVSGITSVDAGQWKNLNLWSFSNIGVFASRYRQVNVFGYPVELTAVFLFFVFLIVGLATLLSLAIYAKRGLFSGGKAVRMRGSVMSLAEVRASRARRRERSFPLSLAYYEIYKQRAVLLLLILLAVVKAASSSVYFAPQKSVSDTALKKYISEIGGPYTDEKAEYIAEKYAEYTSVKAEYEQAEGDLWSSSMPGDEFERLRAAYMKVAPDVDALEYLNTRSEYLARLYETRGIRGSYIYDTSYYTYVNAGVDWLLLLFVAVISCRMYLYENRQSPPGASILSITSATARGRGRLFFSKLLVCLASSSCAWLVFKLMDVFFLVSSHELPDMNASIFSMPRYEGSLFNLTIWGYLAVTTAAGLLGVLLISAFSFSLGYLIKKPLAAYPALAAVLAVPYLAVLTGVSAMRYVDPSALCDADRLYMLTLELLPAPLCAVILGAVFAAVSAALLTFSFRRLEHRRG